MKRIFLAASIIIAAASLTNSVSANASTTIMNVKESGDGKHISPSQVPAPVLQSFSAKFPGATNAQWEKENEHGGATYKVEFLNNGNRWRAVFASNGTLLSSGKH